MIRFCTNKYAVTVSSNVAQCSAVYEASMATGTEPCASVLKLSNSWLSTVAYRGGGFRGFNTPTPEIPKALQNRTKLNLIVKTVKKLLNLGRQHTKMFRKMAVKF